MAKPSTITPSPAGLPEDLQSWLQRLELAHPQEIDLGLERVAAVAKGLAVLNPDAEVVTIGGTNGKGSVAASVAALADSVGYRVGLYSSPHFVRFNERIKVAGIEATDSDLIAALQQVELARQGVGVSLTYFEHATLAAFWLFQRSGCDLWVLEVGLGGRLDAVNLIDADVAVVTRIAHDHAEWLGHDLASIAREKAGIFRTHKAAIIGQAEAPEDLHRVAEGLEAAPVWQAGKDFYPHITSGDSWDWCSNSISYRNLPYPGTLGLAALANAATAIAAFQQLTRSKCISSATIGQALSKVRIIGRLQLIECAGTEWLFDVAHNADSAAELARVMSGLPKVANCHAVLAVARRKEAGQLIAAVAEQVDYWYLPALGDPQMFAAVELAGQVRDHKGEVLSCEADLLNTLAVLKREVEIGDRIVVFGSFRTVTAVLQQQGWG